MPSKRKRGIATTVHSRDSTPRKRQKGTARSTTPTVHTDEDDVRDYYPKGIIGEKRVKNKTYYRINWEPDAQTGEVYEPSWEPTSCVGPGLIDDWKAEKAKKEKRGEDTSSPSRASATQTPIPSPAAKKAAAKTPKRKARARRQVIDSDESSPSRTYQSTPGDSHEFASTQSASRRQAYVSVPEPSPSYYRGEYIKVPGSSQLQSSSIDPDSQRRSDQTQPSGSQYLPSQVVIDASAPVISNSISQDTAEIANSGNIASSVSQASAGASGLFVPDSQSGHEETDVQDATIRAKDQAVQASADAAVVASASNLISGLQAISVGSRGPRTQSRSSSSPRHPSTDVLDYARPYLTLNTGPLSQSEPPTQPGTQQATNILPTSFQRPLDTSSLPGTQPATTQSSEQPNTAQSGTAEVGRAAIPAGLSSPFESTPSVILLPSQAFAIGESAPPRPETLPSIETMEHRSNDSSPANVALARLKAFRAEQNEKLRDVQEKRAQEQRARREGTAHSTKSDVPVSPIVANPAIAAAVALDNPGSPMTIPAVEPQPVITQEEMNTSERYATLIPEPDGETSEQPRNIASITAPEEIQRHEDGIHLVPIAMTGHQRDTYPQNVIFCESAITAYLDANPPDEQVTKGAELALERLRKITTHPDLVDADKLTPPDAYDVNHGAHAQAQWDQDTSSKFRFINELYKALKSSALEVAIVCPYSDLANKVNVFLTNIGARTHLLDESTDSASCRFSVVNIQDIQVAKSPVDLVIGIDHTLTQEQMVSKGLLRQNGRLTRTIALIVPNSVEHIELSVSKSLPRYQRLRVLLNAIQQYRRQAGKIADAEATVNSIAVAVARFMTSDQQAEWAVPSLTVLHDLDSQTQTESSEDSELRQNGKRSLNDGESFSHKKVKLNAASPTTHSQTFNSTRVSDSVNNLTSSNAPSSGDAADDDVQSLRKRLREADEKCDELAEAMEGLQFRFEEQRQQFVELTNEREQAVLTASRAATRLEEQQKALSTKRAECIALKEQLEEAQAALISHAVPERAEVEAIRGQLRAETAAREKAEVRIKSIEGERDYARESYQTASTQATEFMHQSRELEKQLGDAESRASTEQAKLRQLHLDAHAELLAKENRRLKAQLKEREAALKIRDEEIARYKEAGRGRMGTRGNSIPRSPRMGSPLKMATDGRGRTSRAVSPSKSNNGIQHPLRNG